MNDISMDTLSLYSAEHLRKFLSMTGASHDMFLAISNIMEKRAELSCFTENIKHGLRFGMTESPDHFSETDRKLLALLEHSESSFAEISEHLNTAYEIYCKTMEPLYRIYDNSQIPAQIPTGNHA